MTLARPRILRLFFRKTKRLLEWFIYGLFDKLVLSGEKSHPFESRVAIVHLKLIGDFFLWLPYAKALAKHMESMQKEAIFIVNSAVHPLTKQIFPSHTVIGVDRTTFTQNFFTRKALLKKLRHLKVGVVYIDAHPRDRIIEDSIVNALCATAWGFDSTFPDRPKIDCWLSARRYYRLIPAMDDCHQSIRLQFFLDEIGVPKHYIEPISREAFNLKPPPIDRYFVIAPGTSRAEKCWPISNFVEIACKLLENFPGSKIIILGSSQERALGETIAKAEGEAIQNYAGRTNLLEFINWIAHAELVIGNDSSACHIAAACGIKSLAIVGGGHPGWFFPYPSNSTAPCTPNTILEPMKCFGCDWICRYQSNRAEPFPCISRITSDRVWLEISNLLLAKKG